MIRINLLSEEQKKLAAELLKFEETHRAKSFSQRNPDKKMVKCLYCVEGRHVSPICKPRYAERTGTFTVGRSFVKGRRIIPHRSRRKLQLVIRTLELFPKYEARSLEPLSTMKLARAEASRTLRSERKVESKRVRDQQKRSRKINRRG